MNASPQNSWSPGSLKPSRYNIVAEHGEALILYNALSGARLFVRDPSLFHFVRGLETEVFALPAYVPRELLETLATSSFLVPTDFDELAYVLRNVHVTGRKADLRRVTVVLTKRCNLGCAYCFQSKDEPERTSDHGAIRRYVISEIVPGGALQVTWFGGEPTLRLNSIVDISRDIIARGAEVGCAYRATISTNGVLLDDVEKVRALRSSMVEQFQITLDGPEAIQEQRRPSLTKKPTYRRIIEGITNVLELGGSVILKVIVDADSLAHVPRLFEDLRDRGLLHRLRLAIQETESKFAAGEYGKRFRDEAAFAAAKLGLLQALSQLDYFLTEPERKDEFCPATSPYTSVIDSAGALYRCGTERENYVGRYDGASVILERQEYQDRFVQDTQLRLKECQNCRVLPICGGGCTLAAQGMADRGVCSFYRYGIRGYLGLLEAQTERST